MSVLKVLHIEQNTLRNTVLKITNLDLTSGNKTLKLNNLYVYNGTLSNPLIIHYTGSSVTLPIQEIASPPVFYKVDWGDGTIEDLAINNPSHAYTSSQLYIIKIYIVTQGILVRFDQYANPMWNNISRIPSLGNERFCSQMFRIVLSFPSQVTSDLETLWDTSQVTDMSLMFENSVFNGAIGGWNTGNVIGMSAMFRYAHSFNKPLNNWNTGNVTAMAEMFRDATSFDQPLDNNWNTINVYYMSAMFLNATSFNQPLDTWNTSNVITMNQMFQDATSFDGDVNPWNTINVTDMASMFQNTPFNKPLDNWDTSNVTTMNQMFRSALSFDQPLNTFLTGKVVNMSAMFQNTTSFNRPLNNWNTIKVVYMDRMFQDAGVFSQDLGDWDVSNVQTMEYMFFGTGGGVSGGAFTTNNYKSLRNWNISSVLYMANMFKYQIQVPSYSPPNNYSFGTFTTMLYQWGVNSTLQPNVTLGVDVSQGVTDIQYQNTTLKQYYQGLGWFFEQTGTSGTPVDIWSAGSPCSIAQFQFIWEGLNIETLSIPISSPSTYTVNWGDGNIDNYGSTTSTTHTYADDGTYVITVTANDPATTFQFENGSNFYTNFYSIPCCGYIKDCTNMFTNVTSSTPQILETLKWWNTSTIQKMEAMFQSAEFPVLDLSRWDLSSVSTTKAMFKGAVALVIFEDSTYHWDTSTITNMEGMFELCYPITMTNIIQLQHWNVSSVTSMADMFTELINIQTFTTILNGWKIVAGVQNGVTIGVSGAQQAYAAGGLQTYYNSKNWVFKDWYTGNTINIWI